MGGRVGAELTLVVAAGDDGSRSVRHYRPNRHIAVRNCRGSLIQGKLHELP
jgi:hypothetical protein